MISELLKLISNRQIELFFYLEEGALKNKLVEKYMEETDADAEILDFEHNAAMRITQEAGATKPTFDCRLEASEFQYQCLFSSEDFATDEINELIELLRPHCPAISVKKNGPKKNILRKKKGDGLWGLSTVATTLGLSPRTVKALIPCSETRIEEKDGNKTIKEYYWDIELIERFQKLWVKQTEGRGYNSEDLTLIAEHCCAGDRKWARDCITDYFNQRKLTSGQPDTD